MAQPDPSSSRFLPEPQLVPPAADLDFYVRDMKEDPIFGSDAPAGGSWQPLSGYSPFAIPTSSPSALAPPPTTPPPSSAPAVAGTRAFWTLGFWQQFFNVDDADVYGRICSSGWPLRPPEYLAAKRFGYLAYLAAQDQAVTDAAGVEPPPELDVTRPPGNPDPDLYGPLWIGCTLWLTVAVVAQLVQALNCSAASAEAACQRTWYDLIVAAGWVVATYQLCVPAGLWAVMRWQGLPVGLVDTLCLYGYSLAVFVPASVVCAVPWAPVQWGALAAAFAVSALHIVANLVGVWRRSLAPKWFLIVAAGCLGLHALLCLVLKYLFFWTLQATLWPDFMDCKGAAVCGVLTLESGLGDGVYAKWPPTTHGLWPQTRPFGNSACLPPVLSAAPTAAAACFDDFGFQLHEWQKHGICAGTPSATDYFRQICSLAAHPLQLMAQAGRDFDAQLRALRAAGLAIFNVDTRNFQFHLSACAGCDGVWVLAPQSAFPQRCAGACRPAPPQGRPTAQDVCVPGQQGPPCATDADCRVASHCLRCARSGFCTDVPWP